MALETAATPASAPPLGTSGTTPAGLASGAGQGRLSPQVAGAGLATTTALIWGGMFAVAASALPRLDSYHLTLVRYGIASLLFVGLLWWREGLTALRPEGRAVRLFVLGSLGFAGFNLFAYIALDHISPASASLVVATSPLVAAAAGWVRYGVRPPAAVLAAGAVAVVGVATVLGHGDPLAVAQGATGPASLLVLLGVISFVVYTQGAGDFPGWSALRYTTLTAIGGTVTILVATEIAESVGAIGVPQADDYVAVLPQLVYVILLAAVVAVLGWNGAVQRIGILSTSLFITLVPVTAYVIDAVRGAPVRLGDLVGIALVLVALVGANVAQRRRLKA